MVGMISGALMASSWPAILRTMPVLLLKVENVKDNGCSHVVGVAEVAKGASFKIFVSCQILGEPEI